MPKTWQDLTNQALPRPYRDLRIRPHRAPVVGFRLAANLWRKGWVFMDGLHQNIGNYTIRQALQDGRHG
jgi:ABC-type Fe3+ transport system substrate-binding protein